MYSIINIPYLGFEHRPFNRLEYEHFPLLFLNGFLLLVDKMHPECLFDSLNLESLDAHIRLAIPHCVNVMINVV